MLGQRRFATRSPLTFLLAGLAVAYLPVGLALPLLPPFVQRTVGGGGAVVGIVIGAEAVTAMLVRPFVAGLGARHGRRRMFFVAASIIAAATLVNVIADSLWLIITGRLILGVGSGMLLATSHAWAIGLAKEGRRGWALGQVGLVTFVAVAAGAPISLALRSLGGFNAAWAFGGGCALGGALLIRLVAEPPDAHMLASRGWQAMKGTVRPGVGVAAAFAGYASMASFAALALSGRGVAGGAIVLTSCAVSLIAVRLLFGGMPDRFGALPVAMTCAGCEAAGLVLLAAASSLPTAVAGGALIGLGIANIYPAMGLRLIERVRPEERTVAIGSLGAFIDLGYAGGAPIAGAIVSIAGYSIAFAVMACVVLLAVHSVFFDPPGARVIARPVRKLRAGLRGRAGSTGTAQVATT